MNHNNPKLLVAIVTILFYCGWNVPILAIDHRVIITPSRWVLTEKNESIDLTCTALESSSSPVSSSSSSITFNINNRQVFDSSKPNQTDPNVKRLNETTIQYSSKLSNGLKVRCSIDHYYSDNSIIHYISNITYIHDPNQFNVSKAFVAICNVSISPPMSNYSISFRKDDHLLAEWIKTPNNQPRWIVSNNGSLPNELNVTRGYTKDTIHTAKITPNGSKSKGKYYCAVTIPASDQSLTFESNYIRNSSSQTIQSFSLWFVIYLVLHFFPFI